jgi:hypothetical protein
MILFISNLGAQHWAESSSRWKYICFSALNGGAALCFDLQVSGQFVVDGVLCYKIDGGDRRLYTYESGDTAYIYLNGAFRPMYYFGARLGDTVLLYNDSTRFNRGPEYLHGIVDSIVTQNIFGQALKRFYVSIIDTLTYHTFYSISYAEKLGYTSNNGFVFYPSYENIIDGWPNFLCNYGDSTFQNYWLYPTNYCDTHTGLEDPAPNISLRFYPNPSSGNFNIDMSGFGSGVKTIHIYDQLGQVVSTGETDRSELALDLHLAGGMYEVEVMADGRSGRNKLIIE